MTHPGSTAGGGRAGAEPDSTGLRGGEECLSPTPSALPTNLLTTPLQGVCPFHTQANRASERLCGFARLTCWSQDKTPWSLPGLHCLDRLPVSRGGPRPEGPERCGWKERSLGHSRICCLGRLAQDLGALPGRQPGRLGSATALLKPPLLPVYPWPGASSLPAQAPVSPLLAPPSLRCRSEETRLHKPFLENEVSLLQKNTIVPNR